MKHTITAMSRWGNSWGPETDGPWAFMPRIMPPFMALTARNNGTSLRSAGAYERMVEAHHSRIISAEEFKTALKMAGYESF